MESAVRERVAKLKAIAATLEADRDVALSDLPGCLARLEEIWCLQGRQNDLRSEAHGVVNQNSHIDTTALTPFIETARNVLRHLEDLRRLAAW